MMEDLMLPDDADDSDQDEDKGLMSIILYEQIYIVNPIDSLLTNTYLHHTTLYCIIRIHILKHRGLKEAKSKLAASKRRKMEQKQFEEKNQKAIIESKTQLLQHKKKLNYKTSQIKTVIGTLKKTLADITNSIQEDEKKLMIAINNHRESVQKYIILFKKLNDEVNKKIKSTSDESIEKQLTSVKKQVSQKHTQVETILHQIKEDTLKDNEPVLKLLKLFLEM